MISRTRLVKSSLCSVLLLACPFGYAIADSSPSLPEAEPELTTTETEPSTKNTDTLSTDNDTPANAADDTPVSGATNQAEQSIEEKENENAPNLSLSSSQGTQDDDEFSSTDQPSSVEQIEPDVATGFITQCNQSNARHCNETHVKFYNNTDFEAIITLSSGTQAIISPDELIQQTYAVESDAFGTQLRLVKKIMLNSGAGELLHCSYHPENYPIKIAPGRIYEIDIKYDPLANRCDVEVQKYLSAHGSLNG